MGLIVAVIPRDDRLTLGRSSVGIVGCGLHGTWAGRCLATIGFGPGVCSDVDQEAAERLAAELGCKRVPWPLGCDVVVSVKVRCRGGCGRERAEQRNSGSALADQVRQDRLQVPAVPIGVEVAERIRRS